MTATTPSSGSRTPDRRRLLTEAALALLEESGPDAMTTRKVSAQIGVSSMAVYSEFGSFGGLVQGVAEVGFARLEQRFRDVSLSEDPVLDLARLALAYRAFALGNANLYSVMYSLSNPSGHRREGAELELGIDAFMHHVRAAERAMEKGRFRRADLTEASIALWTSIHGWVAMELSGYTAILPGQTDSQLRFLFATAFIGLGDSPDLAKASVDTAFSIESETSS